MIKRSINLNIGRDYYGGIQHYIESINETNSIKVERFSKKSEYGVKKVGEDYLIINLFKSEEIGLFTLTNNPALPGLVSDEYETIQEKVKKELIGIILDYIYNEGQLERVGVGGVKE